MLRSILTIVAMLVLTTCKNPQDNSTTKKERLELVPEPDKDVRDKYEAEQKLISTGCLFLNPDTSLSKVKLRDSESAESLISKKDKMDNEDQYHYYSANYKETLTMTQHAGDGKYVISIFKVEYADKADHRYRKLSAGTFKTEKGIKLGLNKKEIIERLGNCYATHDSTTGYIELYYRLETPNDSRTRILENNNMPVYYASYKLWKDRLEKFEFGFEYP